MAKRKTKTPQAETQPTTQATYVGEVKLKYQVNGVTIKTQTIKNLGTKLLFQGIASKLEGFTGTTYTPKYLDISIDNGTPTSKVDLSTLPGTILLTNRVHVYPGSIEWDDNSATYKAPFTATITPSDTKSKFNCLGLYGDAEGNTLLAYIYLEETAQLTENITSVIVEWVMSIKNS